MQEQFWKSFDIVKALALVVVVAWIAAIFLKVTDSTLTNVVMIIVGFFYGSSTGSKAKDAALIAPPPEKAPAP